MSKKTNKMGDDELVAIIKSLRAQSLGDLNADLVSQRASAMDHYHGRPYGDEQDGRSKIVSRDLAETVEWIMPALMRIFLQSGNIAEFTPVGPEDEESAKQESDYVNHVIMNDNDGFLVLYDWIKETLLLKNGYVKHYWEENDKIRESEYEGQSAEELTMLLQRLRSAHSEVEILSANERKETIETPEGAQEVSVYDTKIRTKTIESKIKIEAVPTEEIRVSKKCRGSLSESPFVEHNPKKTRSQLLEMGMDREFVENAPAFNESSQTTASLARDSTSDESNSVDGMSADRSIEEVEFCEAYLQVDYDGDGISELRKVVTIGNKIPPGAEWNEQIETAPITGMVCKRVPHRHIGESLDDELGDLQRIKTVLQRQLFDNIYGTNNQELVINELAHLPDFMVSLPNGIKRIRGEMPVANAVMPLMRQPIIDQILPALDYVDSIKESRTGINKTSTGMDPDVLKQSTKGAFIENMNKASQKVEMIARMLAETGIKTLVQRVHELTIKHQDKPKIARLRGKYININPQEWRDRTDLTVKVGLGTGTGEEKRQNLTMLAQMQDRLMPMGLVGDSEAYNLFIDMSETLGVELPDKYAINPTQDNPKYQHLMQQKSQPPPNPMAEAEQVKGQFLMQRDQAKGQLDFALEQMRTQSEHSMQMMQMRMEQMNSDAERRSREAIAVMQAEIKAMMDGYKIDIGKAGVGAEIGAQ